MIDDEILYVPTGKYTIAGVLVEDKHLPGAHRPPELMARFIAAVSSDSPSPMTVHQQESFSISSTR